MKSAANRFRCSGGIWWNREVTQLTKEFAVRRICVALSASLLVVLVGITIFVATFDVDKYRGAVQNQLQKGLGRPIKLGNMHVKLFPPRFAVDDLAIFDDPQFSPYAPFLKAEELGVSVKFLPLLHKQIEIESISLERPSINLIKNPAGMWNFGSIIQPRKMGTAKAAPPISRDESTKARLPETVLQQNSGFQNTSQIAEQRVSVGELIIRNGQISLVDQTQDKTRSVYDHIDVTLKNFALNSPFTIEATVRAGSGNLKLQGSGGPLAEQDFSKTPFSGTLNLKGVGIAALTKFLNSSSLNGTDGVINGQLRVTNDSGKLAAQGDTTIKNAKVHGMDLGYPVSAQYDIIDDLSSNILAIRKLMLKLGPVPIQVTGTVDSKSLPARINIKLRATNVSYAEASPVLGLSHIQI
jgi:AsmA protein